MAKIEEIIAGEKSSAPELKADPSKGVEKPEAKEAPAKADPVETDAAPPNEGGVFDSDPTRQIAGLKAASTSERKKRQDAEARLAEFEKKAAEEREYYRKQLDRLTAMPARQPEAPPVPKPSIFENPEDWERQVVGGAVQTLEQRMQQQWFKTSELLARRTYKDEFDEAEKWAEAQVQRNPIHPIRQMVATSDDPGETLVQEYRKQKQLAEMADPVAYRQKLLDEMLSDPEQKKALLEKLGSEPLRPSTPATALPTNLAGSRSLGGRQAVWSGQTPLADIIGGKAKAK